jgi:hypothetical protein
LSPTFTSLPSKVTGPPLNVTFAIVYILLCFMGSSDKKI